MTKTLAQLAIDAIVNHGEFRLLQTYHKELFGDYRLDNRYVNYSLDFYNHNIKNHGNIETIKESLVRTIEFMISDYNSELEKKDDSISE